MKAKRADLWTDIDNQRQTSALSSPPSALSGASRPDRRHENHTQAPSSLSGLAKSTSAANRVLDAIETLMILDDSAWFRIVMRRYLENHGETAVARATKPVGTAPLDCSTLSPNTAPWATAGSRLARQRLYGFTGECTNRRLRNEHSSREDRKNGIKSTIFRTRYRPRRQS